MRRPVQPRGFTLVELLVSMAIALLLIIGVNAVFQTTAKTVGAGHSLLSAGRDARTFLQTMYADMQAIDPVATPSNPTPTGPFFVIQSSHVYAFRNFDDQQGAACPVSPAVPWQDTTLFPSGSPLFSSNTAPVPFVHFRSHRIDKFGFFGSGLFTRQTSSNSSSFTSSTTSPEAWIIYEHVMQPNKGVLNNSTTNAKWWNPGDATGITSNNNDYNYFAADWMLGRLAILLVPSPSLTDTPYLLDTGGLTPLTTNSPASGTIANEAASAPVLTSSRLDIAGISIANFNDNKRSNGPYTYSATGLYNYGGTQVSIAGYAPNYIAGTSPAAPTNPPPNPMWNYGSDWWDPMINQRIQASPYLLTPSASTTAPKLDPYGLATAAPSLIRGCTQFIVEYAGNYYTKDPVQANGNPLVPQGYMPQPQARANTTLPINTPIPDPSGALDYFVDASGNRRIRWYGFPRLVSLASGASTAPVLNATYGQAGNSAYDAVVPLRDVLNALNPSWGVYANAERFTMPPTGFSPLPTVGSNYWTAMSPTADSTTPYLYTAAWGPDSTQPFPKMIRIVICIDDHEGRLSQPQFYEYVFDVQQ